MAEDRTCWDWPSHWPHALPQWRQVPTTDDPMKVTCAACIEALGSGWKAI